MQFDKAEWRSIEKLAKLMNEQLDAVLDRDKNLDRSYVSKEAQKHIQQFKNHIRALEECRALLGGFDDVSIGDFLYRHQDPRECHAYQTAQLQNALRIFEVQSHYIGFGLSPICSNHDIFSSYDEPYPIVWRHRLMQLRILDDNISTLSPAKADAIAEDLYAATRSDDPDIKKYEQPHANAYRIGKDFFKQLFRNKYDHQNRTSICTHNYILGSSSALVSEWCRILTEKYGIKAVCCSADMSSYANESLDALGPKKWDIPKHAHLFRQSDHDRVNEIQIKTGDVFVEKYAMPKIARRIEAVEKYCQAELCEVEEFENKFHELVREIYPVFLRKFGFIDKKLFDSYHINDLIKHMNTGASFMDAVRMNGEDTYRNIMLMAQADASRKMEEQMKKQAEAQRAAAAKATAAAENAARDAAKALAIEEERRQLEEEYLRKLDEIKRRQKELQDKL